MICGCLTDPGSTRPKVHCRPLSGQRDPLSTAWADPAIPFRDVDAGLYLFHPRSKKSTAAHGLPGSRQAHVSQGITWRASHRTKSL